MRVNPPPTPALTTATAGLVTDAARPKVVQLVVTEKAALYAAYIPLFKEGGVFIPTAHDYQLGAEVHLMMTLPNDAQHYPVAGKVAWVTPAKAAGNRTQGVGVRFPNDEKSRLLRLKIEEILGTLLASDKPTQTI